VVTYPEPQEHSVRFFELGFGVERVCELKGRLDRCGLLIIALVVLELVIIADVFSVTCVARSCRSVLSFLE
jgi:hypothetical protein